MLYTVNKLQIDGFTDSEILIPFCWFLSLTNNVLQQDHQTSH